MLESLPTNTAGKDEQTRPAATTKQKSAIRELIETILLTAVVFFAIRLFLQNYQVEGHSMDPTMHNGEFVVVLKAVYWFQHPQTGDIIVLQDPQDPSRDFIKRVIGVPGDTVAVHGGKVYLNGKPLNEPYILQPPLYTVPPTKVPPGKYWVLGDNRNDSNDSHIWGFLPQNEIIGKAWLVYWPPSRWGLVPHARYDVSTVPPSQ
ncbi:MAG: signal peptidase I [Chloroflexi bacterium]|nr:signal peptidase I [Chloroflexota bacterium]